MKKIRFNIKGAFLLLVFINSIGLLAQQQQNIYNSISKNNSNNKVSEYEKVSVIKPNEDIYRKIKDNIFVRIETSKKECYVGEPLLVVYKLCSRLHCNSKVILPPSFVGCSVVEMTSSDIKEVEEKINGKAFQTYTIRKVQLFPLQEGKLVLSKMTIENEINFIEQHNGQNISVKKKVELSSDSISVLVKPLPIDTLKSGFTGAVGKFFMIGKVSKVMDTANDNNQLEITISGNGNFMSIACPYVAWPKDVQAFDMKTTELLDKLSFPILGEKKFLIPFICKKEGEVVIPPIIFKYFDADAKQFMSTEIDSIHIKVAPPIHINVDNLIKAESSLDDDDRDIIIISIVVLITLIILFTVVWKWKKKKSLRQYEKFIIAKSNSLNNTIPQDRRNETIEIEEVTLPKIDFRKLLSSLSDIEDEKIFYKDAISLCENMLSSQSYSDEEEELNKIIAHCNEAIYSSIDTNSYLIFLRLEKMIG